jgi:hypothetical protein
MLLPTDQRWNWSCLTNIVWASTAEVNSIRNRDFLELQLEISAHDEVEGEEGRWPPQFSTAIYMSCL